MMNDIWYAQVLFGEDTNIVLQKENLYAKKGEIKMIDLRFAAIIEKSKHGMIISIFKKATKQ